MIWRLFGLIVYIIGNHLRRIDWVHVGWYMMGTGRKRTMPDWAWEWVHEIKQAQPCHSWFSATLEKGYFHNAVGKFLARKVGVQECAVNANGEPRPRYHMLDRYVFYPCCAQYDFHGANCKCTSREWKHVDIAYRLFDNDDAHTLWYRAYKRVFLPDRVHRQIKIMRDITVYMRRTSIRIEACDRFFADKGKPFYVSGPVPDEIEIYDWEYSTIAD